MNLEERQQAYGTSSGVWPRRKFIKHVIASAATSCWPIYLQGQRNSATLHISDTVIGTMPEQFTGLSYESSELSDPTFFSSENHTLGNLFRTLGRQGVLRLGGNSSELTFWQSPVAEKSRLLNRPIPAQNGSSGHRFPITPRAIENLGDFLKAIDWRLIYGLNLATGDVASAVEEAAHVSKTVGEPLIGFQFGNEPDLLAHSDDKSRRWTYEEFIARWKLYYSAIRVRLPAVNIFGPDTASRHDWVARFASDTTGEIALLTSHYYAEGPPSDPGMTIDYLLHTGKRFNEQVSPDIRTARQSRIPYRMSEGNTCYSGGKAGVSNTFASALWVLDFMLSVAAAGGSGVNLHGGGDGMYTPIAGSMERGFSARPIYYGMLVAREFLGGDLLETDLDSGGNDVKAYASSASSGLRVAVINREAMPISIQLKVQRMRGRGAGTVWRLEAPSLSSGTDVAVAGSRVTPDGFFTPSRREVLGFQDGESTLHVEPHSAALVTVSAAG
jgi:hypothetical protein